MQVTLKKLNLKTFEVAYASLNAQRPKGDEFHENAAFRKKVKDVLGLTEDGNPDMDEMPEGGLDLELDESTFRYLAKSFETALTNGEVFVGSGSEAVVEFEEVIASGRAQIKSAKHGGNGSEEKADKPVALLGEPKPNRLAKAGK